MAVNNTISQFILSAGQHDVARNNLFRVMDVTTPVLKITEEELVYCKGGKIPARKNPTGNLQYMGMTLPYNTSTVQYEGNDDYALKFYVDADSSVYRSFVYASKKVFDEQNSSGYWKFPSVSSQITVAALDFKYNVIDTITFFGVSFKGFDGIDFDTAGGDGQAIEVTCHFSYLYWSEDLHEHINFPTETPIKDIFEH